MKTSTVKINPLQYCALFIAFAVVFTTGRASANTEVWIGVSGTSTTTNWSDVNNWNNITGTGSSGPNGNDVVFGDGGAATAVGVVNSVVDNNSLNPSSLTFTNNSTAGNFHTVLVPAGVATTNSNGLTVGIRLSPVTAFATTVGFVGGGTLVDFGSMQIDDSMTSSATGSGQLATLDLSGLTNFVYTNATGSITVGGTSSGSEARGAGQLNLASGSNFITVSNLNMALGSGNSGPACTLNLGSGTNIINVANVTFGAGKINNGKMTFQGSTGGLRLRGLTGADNDRNVTVTLGNRSSSGTGTPTGTLDFTGGHPVDVKVNSVTMGKSNQSGAGTGNILLDAGTFDATTITMALPTSSGAATGSLTVNGGFLIVSNLSLVTQTGAGTGNGNLTINGPGTVICSNSILKTTFLGVGNITNHTGGKLIVANAIGNATNAIDNLDIADAALTLPAGLSASASISNLMAGGTANTINVSSIPGVFSYPAQFPILSYVNASGDNSTFVAGTLPGIYKGYISNNVANLSIDIVITNGPALAPLKAISWNGTPTGDWTTNTSTLNWVTNGVSVNYNQGDTVTFNDALTGTTNVNLTQALIPTSLTVNNSSVNYFFSGVGKISGDTGLTKAGTGTLILDNSGTNDFTGGTTITGGTLQVGNNDTSGNLPAAASWDDEGTLAFSHSDNLLISTVISGAGSLAQNGSGILSLNVPETYTGNTLVNNGTLALTGAGTISGSPVVSVQNGTYDPSAAAPSMTLNAVSLTNGTFVVDTNTFFTGAVGLTNSSIRLVANAGSASLFPSTFTTGGQTNYIIVTGVLNVPDSPPLPYVIPIIRYGSATFAGGFNIGGTNFPNSFISNDVANSTIDLVLTAAPYVVTWNGGSATDNNWSDRNNWSGVTIAPNDSLFFDGTTRLNPVNDTAANTTYSNITFNGGAGSFALAGNPVVLSGGFINNSPNPQTVALGVNFAGDIAINGTAAPLIIGGGLTNTHAAAGFTTTTLTGTGILTNLLGSTSSGTNALTLNDAAANWTLLDNASSTPVTVPWALEDNSGTFNFGSASSAPTLISTSINGQPQDNQVGGGGGAISTLNFSNGTFTTSARLNTGTGTGGSTGTINQYGGTFNIGNQFQGANATGGSSAVNLFGGVMNIGDPTNPAPFFVASRGPGVLMLTNSAVLTCGTLDVSRSINSGVPGIVNLNGGTLVASRVGTATSSSKTGTTGSTATFNFNGGVLKAGASSTTFFQGHTTDPIVPITAVVQAGGAIIDSDTNSISFLEPLVTDPNLGGAPDGGLTKLGAGTLTLAAVNTYVGKTAVGAGTLLVDGVQGASLVIVSNNATLGGNGVIGSNVTVNAGGTLSPGDNAVGVLTVAGNVTLGGTTAMEVDKNAGTNDMLVATNGTPATITYGGTLNVTTLAGAIASTDTFKLFSASNYVGSFTTVLPTNPGPGLGWDTSKLNVDGTLSVLVTGPTGPTTNASITSVTLSGTNLVVHGTNNNGPNTTFRYVVLTATNIATPLSNWSPVATNQFNGGTFDYTNPVVPGTARQFIDIKVVP
jgi:fibronectin-binding autotransporter adhesin